MAYEDYLASGSWTSLPPPQQPTGLLETQPVMTPYQRAMAEMQQSSTQFNSKLNSQLSSSGGYRPGIYKPRSSQDLLSGLSQITDVRGGAPRSAAEQARINAFFDAMTPAELAQFQKNQADVVNALLGPSLLTMAKNIFSPEVKPVVTVGELSEASDSAFSTPVSMGNVVGTPLGQLGGYDASLFGPMVTPVVTVGELSEAPMGTSSGSAVSSGGLGLTGSPMGGIASTGTSGQAAAAVAAANAAASGGAGGRGVGTGGVSTSSGSPMGGISSGGGSAASGGSGGGGGGGGGCCFIMLEARYGDGTMDRVVRRYRDEKVTERNKRGYYKLAEVFIPLMRKSKLFSFFVVKTFADPAVCYAKWYYGENKWGWIFKPLEKFWMSLFDTLGTETQFIRENGETV